LRRVEAEVFKALTQPLTSSELKSQTGLRPREIAEALERLTRIGAVERVVDYTLGPRRVRWRRLVDEAELRWLHVRRVVDPLLDEYGVDALEAILDAVAQRPELLSHLKSKLDIKAGR